jgi:hypothetical protein
MAEAGVGYPILHRYYREVQWFREFLQRLEDS